MTKLRLMDLDAVPSFMAQRLDGDVSIFLSYDAIEYLRKYSDRIPSGVMDGRMIKFRIQDWPVRFANEDDEYPVESIDVETNTIRPEWLSAPYEMAYGYGTGCHFCVLYKRKGVIL